MDICELAMISQDRITKNGVFETGSAGYRVFFPTAGSTPSTLWQFSIAMEYYPAANDLPSERGHFPQLC
jgi:hypothetical protein